MSNIYSKLIYPNFYKILLKKNSKVFKLYFLCNKFSFVINIPFIFYTFISRKDLNLYFFTHKWNINFLHIIISYIYTNIYIGVFSYFIFFKLYGIGYNVTMIKDFMVFNLGYTHSIYYKIPKKLNVVIDIKSDDGFYITGRNWIYLWRMSDNFKKIKFFDIYKGKGIAYLNEKIILKKIRKK